MQQRPELKGYTSRQEIYTALNKATKPQMGSFPQSQEDRKTVEAGKPYLPITIMCNMVVKKGALPSSRSQGSRSELALQRS
ncbi:hypothetical protein FKM82_018641 [Ascaphus truei]